MSDKTLYAEALAAVEEIQKREADPKQAAIEAYVEGRKNGYVCGAEDVLNRLEAA